jgi:N utilization substance protein A
MKGMRVQTIIRELRGEKIDIIEYIADPVEMVRWALSPAKVSFVNIVDQDTKHMEVIVDETQLSLAIGKKGQNVRLAAKLLGWRIDIKSEDEKRREVEEAMAAISGGGTPVSLLLDYGLSEGLIDRLIESGAATVEALADMTPEQLLAIPSVGSELIERIQLAVSQCYAHIERTVGAAPTVDVADGGEGGGGDSTSQASDEEAAEPPVLPGVPQSGIAEEEDDEEIDFDAAELEGFGRMNRYRGPSLEAGSPVAGQEGSGSAAAGAAKSGGVGFGPDPVAVEGPGNEEKNDSHQ